jgi:hypothetical protein
MSTLSEPERAIPGVKGGSPRFRAAHEELPALNRLYLEERNAKLGLQRRAAEIDLALREGTLIPRRRAKVQLGFLLTGLRQRLMSLSYSLAPRLVNKSEHEISQMIDTEVRAALRDIATWPGKMVDVGWQETIAPDLAPSDAEDTDLSHREISPRALGELEVAEKRAAAVRKVVIRQREKRKRKG